MKLQRVHVEIRTTSWTTFLFEPFLSAPNLVPRARPGEHSNKGFDGLFFYIGLREYLYSIHIFYRRHSLAIERTNDC